MDRVAPQLVGRFVQRGEVTLRIVEVEAYGGARDTASHARFGPTDRNRPMWGPAGVAYVYLCYGVHWMFNIVTGAEGVAGAVLVRAAEVEAGLEVVRARRGPRPSKTLTAGPGRVGQALGLSRSDSGASLQDPDLRLLVGRPADRLGRSPRVGIDFATARDRDRRWRWFDPASPLVSRPRLSRGRAGRRAG